MDNPSQSIIHVCVSFLTTNINFKFIRNLRMFPGAYFCFRQQLFCRPVSQTSETPNGPECECWDSKCQSPPQ